VDDDDSDSELHDGSSAQLAKESPLGVVGQLETLLKSIYRL
jgi:hypothetical protein